MARKNKKGLIEMLGSPLTMLPIMLGVGAGLFIWATAKPGSSNKLPIFLATVGCLAGLGMLLSMWALQPGPKPKLIKARQELAQVLEALLNRESPGVTQESPQLATEAPVERA
jgi:hypothetical protein